MQQGQLVLRGTCFPHPVQEALLLPGTSRPPHLCSSSGHAKQATCSSPLKVSAAKTHREKPKNILGIAEEKKIKGLFIAQQTAEPVAARQK